jgi:uncharacterized membrane protein YsdA (DUF1294 family)/cold shock CspA family protein
MRLKGSLVEWNDDRGYGFLEPSGGGQRAFCHISALAVRSPRPVVGDRVTYETNKDEHGRLRAVQIRPVSAAAAAQKRSPPRRTSPWQPVVGSILFIAILAGLVVADRLPWFVPLVYLAASGLTIFAFAFDKSAAMNQRWRTQESTLHCFSLLGGWPGAWIAQVLFRHKTRKGSFVATFVLCVIINIAVLAWVVLDPHSPIGEILWKI